MLMPLLLCVQRETIFLRFLPTSDTVVELQKEDIMFSIPSVAQGLLFNAKNLIVVVFF